MNGPSSVVPPRIPVCLVRHGVTAWNREGRIQGWKDIPLSDLGRTQAGRLAGALADRRFSRVITSTLSRARETAEIVARPHGLPVESHPELREYNCGRWEGHNYREIRSSEERSFLAWLENPEVSMPDGESMVAAGCRVAPLVDRILTEMVTGNGFGDSGRPMAREPARPAGGPAAHAGPAGPRPGALLIVGHGGIDRLIAAHLLGFSVEAVRRMQLDNASVSWFEPFMGRYTLCLWNSTAHLDGLPAEEVDPSATGIG